MRRYENYALGKWIKGDGQGTPLYNAINGDEIGTASSKGLDFSKMMKYARKIGGPALRKMTFQERGLMLKKLALHLHSIKGKFSVSNPNFRNTDKSLKFALEASELDNYKTYGYKSNKTGFIIGTEFEYYDDLYLGLGTSNFIEKIETNSTASAQQQSQQGDYWDSFLNLEFTYDKRDQKFQTTDGFLSSYSLDLPYISDTYTLINKYKYSYFTELYQNNVSTFSFSFRSAHSLKDEDIKLSERLRIPSNTLRGFEYGKIGPKDGDDFIGGNYMSAINFTTTVPQILENSQNTDFVVFMDAANLWGVDEPLPVHKFNRAKFNEIGKNPNIALGTRDDVTVQIFCDFAKYL